MGSEFRAARRHKHRRCRHAAAIADVAHHGLPRPALLGGPQGISGMPSAHPLRAQRGPGRRWPSITGHPGPSARNGEQSQRAQSQMTCAMPFAMNPGYTNATRGRRSGSLPGGQRGLVRPSQTRQVMTSGHLTDARAGIAQMRSARAGGGEGVKERIGRSIEGQRRHAGALAQFGCRCPSARRGFRDLQVVLYI